MKEAQQRAREAGLDLVEVAPQSRPPVCRILDYGKFKYTQRKRDQKAKAKRHETELKEVRIRTPKIGEHDLGLKVANARTFLERGDRVQFSLRFRGRELAHIDEGIRIFQRIQEELSDVSKVEQNFRREGRRITMMLAPAGPPKKPEAGAKPDKSDKSGNSKKAEKKPPEAASAPAPAAGKPSEPDTPAAPTAATPAEEAAGTDKAPGENAPAESAKPEPPRQAEAPADSQAAPARPQTESDPARTA